MTRAYCAACSQLLQTEWGDEEEPTSHGWELPILVQPCEHCLAEAAQAAIEGMQDHLADLREAEMEARD